MADTKRHSVTWAEAFRDIVVTAINKGQLAALTFCGIPFFVLWKLPAEKIGTLLDTTIARLAVVSIGMNVALAVAFIFVTRRLRQTHASELDRLGKEKSSLQQQLLNQKLSSSSKGKKP